MICALLDGRKSQTRRALKTQPLDILPMDGDRAGREWVILEQREPEPKGKVIRCRYGASGDLLWVRETHAIVGNVDPGWVIYRASGYENECRRHGFDHPPLEDEILWKPSIHMPRWASRLTLRITNIRVERLQDISEADAIAEGIERIDDPRGTAWKSYEIIHEGKHKGMPHPHAAVPNSSPVTSYRELWDSINGPGSCAANPWVWCISFDCIRANVDEVLKREAA